MQIRDVVVLGGGAGGLVVASGLAQLGLKVALIEKAEKLGGDCLHYGCVPSKTLIHSAKVAHLMKHASLLGLPSCLPEILLSQVNDRVAKVIEKIQVHDSPERFEALGVEVIFGQAKFLDKKILEINHEKMRAARYVIATGSSPMVPPIPGLEDIDYLTNETLFKCRQLPEHLIVIGAGPIGVEISQAVARFGAKVTIIEVAPRLLATLDEQAAICLQQVLEHEGLQIETGVKIKQITQSNSDISVEIERDGTAKLIQGSHLFVATGRTPNLEGLNLKQAGVGFNRRGIEVNSRLKTSNRHIYAVGDIIDSPYKFTHIAESQAGVVIANIAFKFPKKMDYRYVPSVVFCDPEVAQMGATKRSLELAKVKYQTLEVAFKDIDRAITQEETAGFVKLFVRKKIILGAVIVGPHAGELLAEVALAIQHKIKIGKISATIHAYPTLSQVIRRTVNTAYAPKLFSTKTRKLVWLLQKLF